MASDPQSKRLPEASRIESLLDLDEPRADWDEHDLAALFRHQLDAPMADVIDAPASQISIRALLLSDSPAIELLERLKRHAKLRRRETDAAVPADVWRVIYFATIAAAARNESGASISDLQPDELVRGYRWTIQQSFVDPSVISLIQSALDRVTR